MGIQIATLVISTLLSIFTLWLTSVIAKGQKNLQESIANNEEKRNKDFDNSCAKKIILDNYDELLYLPYGRICALYDIKEPLNHSRNIYKEFALSTESVQNRVYELRHIDVMFKDLSWVERSVDLLKKDMEKMNLGNGLLYDTGKYFFNTKYFFSNPLINEYIDLENPSVVPKQQTFTYFNTCKFDIYYSEYMSCINKEQGYELKEGMLPPFEYIKQQYNLGNSDDSLVCYWVMRNMIKTLQYIIDDNDNLNDSEKDFFTDILEICDQNFEDLYYKTIYMLYFAYKDKLNIKR